MAWNKPSSSPHLVKRLHTILMEPTLDRSPNVIHASDVVKENHRLCGRERALCWKSAYPRPLETLSTSMRVTFAIGRDLQDWVVNVLASAGEAVALWQCLSCGVQTDLPQYRPVTCGHCGSKGFRPRELVVRGEGGVRGGIDCLVKNATAFGFIACEIKSMDKEQFKSLVYPLAEHRVRTKLYLKLINEDTGPHAEWTHQYVSKKRAVVLYVSKGGYGTMEAAKKAGVPEKFSPFKEYVVEAGDEEYFKPGVQQAKAYEAFRNGGPLPDRICVHDKEDRAVKCPMRLRCFSDNPLEDL